MDNKDTEENRFRSIRFKHLSDNYDKDGILIQDLNGKDKELVLEILKEELKN
ncbi:MAG: hypothetical protein P8Y70_02220 [Candidatus Lokiarchaeota archaeon]